MVSRWFHISEKILFQKRARDNKVVNAVEEMKNVGVKILRNDK